MENSTIMIVDENPDALLVQELLVSEQIEGCEICPCSCPNEALRLAQQRKIDGAIIGVRLSGMNGIEVCRNLKNMPTTKQIPVMLIAEQKSSRELKLQGLDAGADDFITKPIDDVEFIARIRIMLRVKQAEDRQRAATLRLNELVAEHAAALRASEERYRRLVEISPDIIVVCTQGRTTFINEAGLRTMKVEAGDGMLGFSVLEMFQPDARDKMEQLLADCEAKGEKTPFVETKLRTLNESAVDVEVAAIPFEYRGRRHIQLVIRDITERKQIGDRFRQSQRMEAVGKLAGGVAHDFNNVLTTIRGYSDLIQESLSPSDPIREDVTEIRLATERAASLTRQLLAFSRRQVLAPKALDLNTVVLDMKRMLIRMIGEDITLVTDLETELETIKADQSQIEQVIMNLAVNARDAIEDGGKLTISTRNVKIENNGNENWQVELENGDYVVLEVADTGIGMSEETAFHIFEPFFSTKPKDKGTGLGLSTVYGIVKQSGGDISVVSEPSVGTTFRVFLPVVSEEASLSEVSRIERGAVRGWETILVAEDEPSVRTLTTRMLARAGYTVLKASNGAEALRVCEEYNEPIHMILTDVVMPEMGGRELVERLFQIHPEMRFLLMSGYSDEAVVGIKEILREVTFLEKPFTYEELTLKVRSVFDRS